MEEQINTFGLSSEQQDTAGLLLRLLGKAIADRYVDFCRLAAGAFELRVSRPLAAHALRELESLLRRVLEVPMEAKAALPIDPDKLKQAQEQLAIIGFQDADIGRAASALKPRISHKTQIRQIVERLGLALDGDIANAWVSLCDTFGRAHERSFHRSLEVDDEFRSEYQEPFDTVIRAVSLALQSRYAALMRRVEELMAMPDRAQAVSLFASEIPGALSLQWHFFRGIQTGDWLPHLVRADLLGEPLAGPEEGARDGMRFRQWPPGAYLLRMAASPESTVRHGVIDALRNLASSKHPDIQHDGMEILAELPADEAAPLAYIVAEWLSGDARFLSLQAPEKLLKKLARARHGDAALLVARALFRLWEQNSQIASHYGQHMYEYHLPSVIGVLTDACGQQAVRFFAELLEQAGAISGKERYSYHSSRSVKDDQMAAHDIYDALVSAVRRSAETVVTHDPARMGDIMALLEGFPSKIFRRLAVHVLALNPAAAPDIATGHLTDAELIEQSWSQHEYAELALAWFPSLPADKQSAILAIVDAIPVKYLPIWKARFEEHTKAPPTAEGERKFASLAIRDAVWGWRSVLPVERQAALTGLGDPDAWRHNLFPPEESPLSESDLSARPISDVVAFLKSWRPLEQPQRQTVTALAQELRKAVGRDPATYAANAERFAGLSPIYVRRVLEGLQNAAANQRDFKWAKVLSLIDSVYAQFQQPIASLPAAEGDDPDWTYASGEGRGDGC
jgi:hypothetical protein